MHTFRVLLALATAILATAYLTLIVTGLRMTRALMRGFVQRPAGVILAALAALVMISPAMAQVAATVPVVIAATPPTSQTLLHIPQPMWDEINQLLVGLVAALLLMGWKWLDNRNPLKNTQADQIARDAFSSLLTNGAKFGLTQLNAAEKKVGDVDVGNAAVAAGANYVIAQAPALAAKLGYDVSTEEGQAAVIRMVTSRVGDLMSPPGTQPAVLPLPASVQPPKAPTT